MEQRILPSYNQSQQKANRGNKKEKIYFEGKHKGSSKGVKIENCKMEQHALKMKKCSNTNIPSYLETSGVQNSNLSLNVVHFFNTSIDQTSVAA